MASQVARKRLMKESQAMAAAPPPFCIARPREDDILTWHYILRGPPDSDYAGGEYHGVLMFPPNYPFAPPGIKMLTPSGRFAPNQKICTSMSDFHPGTWNPAWSVSTICTGLLSFMLSDELSTGSVKSSSRDRRLLAAQSHASNVQDKHFKAIFPEYAGPAMIDLPDMGGAAATSTSTPNETADSSSAMNANGEARPPDQAPRRAQARDAGSGSTKTVILAAICVALFALALARA